MLFANMCAGFFSFWHGVGGERWFFGFLASSWCLVHPGCTSFVGYPPCVYPHVYRTRLRRCQSGVLWVLWFSSLKAVYASFSGTAQSP